jgi:hypothetical protein
MGQSTSASLAEFAIPALLISVLSAILFYSFAVLIAIVGSERRERNTQIDAVTADASIKDALEG